MSLGQIVVIGGVAISGYALNNLRVAWNQVDELNLSPEDEAALKGAVAIEWLHNPLSSSISPTLYEKLDEV
jgi:hypothetical protein